MHTPASVLAAAAATAVFAFLEPASAARTTITFEGMAAPGGFASFDGGPLVLSGATFTSDGFLFVIDPGYYGSHYASGFLNADYANDANTITVALPPNVYSGAFDFGGLFGALAGRLIVNGATFDFSSENSIVGTGVLDHFNFSSPSPIAAVTLILPDAPNYAAIDNFSYTTGIPEPATWAMLAVASRRSLLPRGRGAGAPRPAEANPRSPPARSRLHHAENFASTVFINWARRSGPL